MKIRTKFGIVIQILCILCLIGTMVFLLINWNKIPSEIPVHFNGAGEADSMGGKGNLIMLHVLSWLLFLGITAAERFPQSWNTGVRITVQNRVRVYRAVYHMIVCAKLSMVLIFSFMAIWPLFEGNLPFWFTPVSLTATFVPMVFFCIQLWRVR